MKTIPENSPAQPLDAALDLASAGLRVFPVYSMVDGKCACGKECGKDAGKHPATVSGFKVATIDVAQIKRWWKKNPTFNIRKTITTQIVNGRVEHDVGSR